MIIEKVTAGFTVFCLVCTQQPFTGGGIHNREITLYGTGG